MCFELIGAPTARSPLDNETITPILEYCVPQEVRLRRLCIACMVSPKAKEGPKHQISVFGILVANVAVGSLGLGSAGV